MVNVIINYLKKQVDVINNSFENAIKNIDYNSIHNFRVASKKFRDIFKLLNYEKNSYLKLRKSYNKNFKKINDKLGKVRELQVSLNLIKSFEKNYSYDLDLFKEYFLKKIHNKQKKLSKIDSEKFKENYKIFFENLEDKLNRYNRKITKYFLSNLNHLVLNTHFPGKDFEDLHDFRITLKKIRYAYEIISESEYKSLIVDINKKIEVLRSYEVMIGNWHDILVFKNFLKKFIETNNENKYYQMLQLKSFYKEVANKVNELFNEIINKIKNDNELNSIFSYELLFY